MEVNVLSLFDGMSCGQLALERAGIRYDKYFASEIDKYAIQITQKNFPKTIQLGDIRGIKSENLPKIDILIGGSPCQGFSFAGKQLNFEDSRSKLFFEYARLLKECKPKYYLLENVKMKKKYQDVVSGLLGVEPILINSALVSAQNRKRLYWTNIPGITQPKDMGVMLKDVLDEGQSEQRLVVKCGRIETRADEKSGCLSAVQKDKILIYTIPRGKNNGGARYVEKAPTVTSSSYEHNNFVRCKSQTILSTIYKENYKSMMGRKKQELTNRYRKLTPIECERLQTVPDNYTKGVSNTQRYKMLGNGWTVDVISHILGFLKHSLIESSHL